MSKQNHQRQPVGANLPSALVIRGSAVKFNPHDPRAVALAIAELLKVCPQARNLVALMAVGYPPELDWAVTLPALKAWVKTQEGFTSHSAAFAWQIVRDLTPPQGKPWQPVHCTAAESQRGYIRLGQVVRYATPAQMIAQSTGRVGAKATHVWERYLTAKGLRFGMETSVWLAIRGYLGPDYNDSESTPLTKAFFEASA